MRSHSSRRYSNDPPLYIRLRDIITCIVILLSTAYLSPSVSNALFDTRGPPKIATHLSVPAEEVSITDQTNGTQGYFMARYYEQQMTQDIINFFEVSNIAVRLNLSMVEPFAQGTHLIGIPDIKPHGEDKKIWKLSMFYDLDHLHATLNTCSSSCPLESFETVLENAPHNVILVYFLLHGLNSFKGYFPGEKYSNIVELDHKKVSQSTQVKQTLTILNTCMNHFKTAPQATTTVPSSTVLLMDARPLHSLPLSAVTEEIGSVVSEEVMNKSGPVLVIIDKWKARTAKNGSRYSYYMPDFDFPRCNEHSLYHSRAVIEAAHKFSLSLKQTQPVIGVHIRGERLLHNTKGNFSYCMLHELTTWLQTLTTTNKIPRERIYVIHDLGSYGTKSCIMGLLCSRKIKITITDQ